MRTFCFFFLFCGALALDLPNNDPYNFTCVLSSQARGQSCNTTYNGFYICQLQDGLWLSLGSPGLPVPSLYMGTSITYFSGNYALGFVPTHTIVRPYHASVLIEASSVKPTANVIYLDPSNPQLWIFSATTGEKCSMPRTQNVCSTPTLTIQVDPDYICPQPYYMSLYASRPDGSHSRGCLVDWDPGVSYISFMRFNTDSDWKDVITVDCN